MRFRVRKEDQLKFITDLGVFLLCMMIIVFYLAFMIAPDIVLLTAAFGEVIIWFELRKFFRGGADHLVGGSL